MGCHSGYTVDNRMGIPLDYALKDIFKSRLLRLHVKAEPVCISRSSSVAVLKLSALPSSSKPTILVAELIKKDAQLAIELACLLRRPL